MFVILPLSKVSGVMGRIAVRKITYQKLKKSLTSFSLVSCEMPLTWTVVDMMKGLSGREKTLGAVNSQSTVFSRWKRFARMLAGYLSAFMG
jgi:hypothetical protein